MKSLLLKSYIGFGCVYLLMLLLDLEKIEFIIKPFFMFFLLLEVYFHSAFGTKKLLLWALTFSWIGDILLLFTERDRKFFLLGLTAFLVTHILYIVMFNKQLIYRNRKNKAAYWIGITGIATLLLAMLFILMPNLGNLMVAVFLYSMVIAIMLLFAFNGFFRWRIPENRYILSGTVLFVVSECILAFNEFNYAIIQSSFLIMSSYLAAQFLIVFGILKLNQKKQHPFFQENAV